MIAGTGKYLVPLDPIVTFDGVADVIFYNKTEGISSHRLRLAAYGLSS